MAFGLGGFVGGKTMKLLTLGIVVGGGFTLGAYLTKVVLGSLQNLTGISPPLASFWADWDAGLPPEEASIPYTSYDAQLNEIGPSIGHWTPTSPNPMPSAGVDYQYDF